MKPSQLVYGSVSLCKNKGFQSFLNANDEVEAATNLRQKLDILSRREIGLNQRVSNRYCELVTEFNGWMNKKGCSYDK